MRIWLNGGMVGARVHLSPTFNYGFGGIRAYWTGDNPLVFKLRDYVERLFRSARPTSSPP